MKFRFDRLSIRLSKFWKQPTAWMTFLGLILIGWIAFFWHLGSTGLVDETEPLFAEAARQMTVTGDWITPFFNGSTRFDKPPLIYWLMAIAYKTIGVNEWAVRLPSALAGFALTCFCCYALSFVRRRNQKSAVSGQRSADEVVYTPDPTLQALNWYVPLLGAAIVALNPYTLFFGRTGYSDMLLSFCMGGALLAFFLGYAQPERRTVQVRWYMTFYILLALAVLTKGPVGVVLPGLIIGSFLLYLKQGREVLRETFLAKGILIILAISLPWYILVILRNGEAYVDSFFGFHNFGRFTHVVNNHTGPWYFHFLVVLIGFAPWSACLPGAIAHTIHQRRYWQQKPRAAQLGLFALFWFGIILGFFTISATKYFSYTLPSLPAAAILVALWGETQITQAQAGHYSRNLKISSCLNLVCLLVLAGICFYCPHWLGSDTSMPNLGKLIRQARLPELGLAIWLGSAIAVGVLWLRRQGQWLLAVNLVGFVAFLLLVMFPAVSIIDVDRQLPLRQIAHATVQAERPGEAIIVADDGFDKSSLVFYTQRPIIYLDFPKRTISHLQKWFRTRPDDKSVLLVASDRGLAKSRLSPSQYQFIDRAGVYQLVRVLSTGIL